MKQVFLRTTIWIIVITLAIMTFALSGCSSGGASAGVKDGIIELKQAKLDFGDNQVPGSSKSSLTVVKLKQGEEPAGLASTLFELYLDVTCDLPVTISIPFAGDDGPEDEEAAVMLGLGNEVILDDGTVDTLYSYIPAEVVDGVATSTFIPSQYLGELAVRGASGSAKASRERLTWGLFRLATSFEEGGHFVVYFPKQARRYLLDFKERHALLSDLEAVYDEYLSKGYAYEKRKEWPMEVYIQSLKQDGYYFYRWDGAAGQIYLNRALFQDGYSADAVKPLLAHEFFHFVQLNYVDRGSDLLWFDEATATYCEEQKAGNYPYIVKQHEELVFSGVFPLENDAVNGYARMPLIKFLSQKRGEDFILNAYTIAGGGAGWEDALLSSAGPPSVWAGDFYEALIKGGEVSHFSPYALHKTLVGDKKWTEKKGNKGKIGTKLELTIPTAEEIDAMVAKGEEPVFGSATVSVGSFGAQLVAITVDEKNLSRLPEGTDPSVSVPGADFRVFAIRGSSVEVLTGGGGAVTLNDFKKLSDDFSEHERDKTLFLVLVTGLHNSGKQDYTVKVGLPAYPTIDELVGQYPNSSMLMAKVYIADEVMAKAQSGSDGGSSGCDAQTLAMLKGMEGREMPVKLVIKKTGENSGSLAMLNEESKKDVGDEVFPFTYAGGRLVFDHEVDGEHLTGSLTAAYGKNKDVTVDGDLNISASDGQVSIDVRFNGSKPLDTE